MKYTKIAAVALAAAVASAMAAGCADGNPKTSATVDAPYVPSSCSVTFPDEDADKIIRDATFDTSAYTNPAAAGDLDVYRTFGSGMCLQRDCINRIYGVTTAQSVAVVFDGRAYYGTVSDGRFQVYLPKMQAGGPYTVDVVTDKGRVSFTDVYVGEVYILSGQSNMEWRASWSGSVLSSLYSDPAECVNKQIRMLDIEANPQPAPTTDIKSSYEWDFARSASIRTFSAIGYLFGKQMQEELGCPVGLISTAVGGTILEYWLDSESVTELKKSANVFTDPSNPLFTPSLGYNGIIYPLLGYNARGVLWYQGESNTFGTEAQYDKGLEILINSWRKAFGCQLSFTVFELARYNERPYAYSVINERIAAVADKMQNVSVVLNLDLGDWNNIHPADKHEIAKRAADVTLKDYFGKQKPSAPKPVSFKAAGNTISIEFDAPVTLKHGSNGFEVKGDVWSYECTAAVSGNTVTVTASFPITGVRYGYTCKMTDDIRADVSKMATLWGDLPVDLFAFTV